jgi:transposase
MFRPVHANSPAAQEVRALLVARKLLQTKLLDVTCELDPAVRTTWAGFSVGGAAAPSF